MFKFSSAALNGCLMLLPRVSPHVRVLSWRVSGRVSTHAFCGPGVRALASGTASPDKQAPASVTPAPAGLLNWLIDRHGPKNIVASAEFNRWLVPPAAISFHACLGAVYAWSILNAPLCLTLGVVGSAAADWTLSQVVPIFSTSIFCLGATSAIAGRHIDRFGPRLFGLASAGLWGGGHLVAAAGVHLHSLPLLYLGYGVLGGVGLGIGYLAPVGLLMSWFPERRGMATGMAIMGFGGGAIVFTPVMEAMMRSFRAPPTFAGPLNSVGQSMDASGVLQLSVDGSVLDVVASSSKAMSSFPGLQEGLYIVGTGSTGLGTTLACLGAGYFLIQTTAAFSWRMPKPNWRPPELGGQRSRGGAFLVGPAPLVAHSVSVDDAMRSPQFYYLWMNLFLNTTAGIGMIGVAKTMMSEIFGSALPTVVTPEFAASYVLAVSLANMGGRFFWATVSDYIGRKNAYYTYFCLGVPLYLSLPCWAIMTQSSPSLALALFATSTMVTFSTFGAGFSTMPAYVGDVFGPKNVSAIFGRVLTAWSAAGVLGPLAITQFRARAERQAVASLADQVGEERFLAAFQAPLADLPLLAETKVVTVQKLLELAPAGTLDPTPYMYNEVMVGMAGLQLLAILSNSRVRLLAKSEEELQQDIRRRNWELFEKTQKFRDFM